MRKSDKKLDNLIRNSLKRLCEEQLEQIDGFLWLTHVVNYSSFKASFKIICVFQDNDSLAQAEQAGSTKPISIALKQVCEQLNLGIKNPEQHIIFDTEENCDRQHQGNWVKRLNQTK